MGINPERRARIFRELNEMFGGPMGLRGLGYLYRPKYRDKKTKEVKESSVWWWDPPGKHPRVSTGCRDKEDARAWTIQRLAELGRGSTIGLRPKPLLFDDLVTMIRDDYKAKGNRSTEHLEDRLKHLIKAFGGRPATEIPDHHVTAYAVKRREAGAAVATINIELCHLHRMFALARKQIPQERIPTITRLPGAHVRMDVLTDADLNAILSKLLSHHRDAIEGLAETGWREQEILGLDWPRVSFDAEDVRLDPEDAKTGEPRYLSFRNAPRLKALLERRRDARDSLQARGIISPWVFCRDDGSRISRSSLQGAWRDARKEAGIIASEGPFIHGLRRKMAKELLDAGASELDAMTVTGHKTAQHFRRYALRSRQSQDRAMAAREASRTVGNQTQAHKVESLESWRK
jgi:integrase